MRNCRNTSKYIKHHQNLSKVIENHRKKSKTSKDIKKYKKSKISKLESLLDQRHVVNNGEDIQKY